ncbi:MAG: hypothetical protein ABJ354_02300, partial [Nitratireductor sp.]
MTFDGETPGWLRRGASNLARAKWVVAAGCAAIAFLAWLGGVDWLVAGLAMAAVLGVAAGGPGERKKEPV